jgi:phosphatidylserine/phosphatidylglycerophosphate/cardiolipin synthase-like enzyme
MRISVKSLIIIIIILFVSCQTVVAKEFEKGRIEIYISTNEDISANRYILEEEIVRFIDEANFTLDIAVQELRVGKIHNSNPIKEAILRAANRNVRIKMIVENDYLEPQSDNLITFKEFEVTPNITIKSDTNPDIFHNKFIIRDKDLASAALLTGSTNFTDTGTRQNYNHIVIIHFTGERKKYFGILDKYQAEFDEMFSGMFGNYEQDNTTKKYRIGNTYITILFSPDDDPDDYLLKTILKANETLDIMMFTFGSNSPLLSGVINRYYAVKSINGKPTKTPKVKVRVAMEKSQARYWSAYPALLSIGIPVKLESKKAKLHHKVGIIDNKTTIIGSYNWTLSANEENDENIIIIGNSDIANYFTEAFDELWNNVLVDPQ